MRRRCWTSATGGLVATVLLVAGCGGEDPPDPGPQPAPGLHTLTLEWAGHEREYLVEAPSGYHPDRPIPLVVVLHGRPGTASGIRAESGMETFAAEHDVLVAYPQGLDQRFHPSAEDDPYDDLGFIRSVVAQLIDRWNAIPGQVYATGFSNGASMSYRLAVEAPDVFSAVAPVSGPYLGAQPPPATEPASVIAFLGLADGALPRLEEGLEQWRDQFGCTPAEPEWVGEQAETVSRTVARCAGGSEAVDYRIEGMAHRWPSADAYGLDVTELMWEFFTAHAR